LFYCLDIFTGKQRFSLRKCRESERKERLGYSLCLISLSLVARHLLKSKPEKHPKGTQTNIHTYESGMRVIIEKGKKNKRWLRVKVPQLS